MVRIVLTGFRGTGKTRTGELLAHMMGVPFLDTDAEIEKNAGMPIYEIFRRYGEDYFRRLEVDAIASLPSDDSVISTGGGSVQNPDNVAGLRSGSIVVLLTASDRAVEERIANTERPSLTKMPLREEIHELQKIRRIRYVSSSDFCIDTTGRDANETAMAIRKLMTEGPVGPGARKEASSFIRKTDIGTEEAARCIADIEGNATDPTTRFYAVAGSPCRHSLSPPLFNRLFSHYNMNSRYLRFCWPDFEDITRIAARLDLRGLSVTLPFKPDALSYASEPDDHAKAIGAANTIVFSGGTSYGFNTDWIGIRGPLEHKKGSDAAVIGAGGAAAAAVYALQSLDMNVTVLNRTPEKGKELAERFSCASLPLSDFPTIRPDIVLNTTPVGMSSSSNRGSPIDPVYLKREMTVFDLVYTPAETPLIAAARKMGCHVIPGTEMFARQAAAQFGYFTGIEVPLATVRGLVI
ncbi:MAG TPA: shikimate dehydrogenase [Methanoregulaceae archaeon]|nr:shikimate dehydrogenase [Methanoregulaceae archaeon]